MSYPGLDHDLALGARTLKHTLHELDEAKISFSQTRQERVMRSTQRSTMPGNEHAIDKSVMIDLYLHELCCDARNTIDPGHHLKTNGQDLCEWISLHAADIAILDQATDILDALDDYNDQADRLLHPERRRTRHDPYQPAPAICQRLATIGIHATPALLRKWAERSNGGITTRQKTNTNTYRLTEIIQHLNQP